MLSEMHKEDCMRIAALEHDEQQLKQLLQKPDTSKELVQLRTAKEFLRDIYLVSASPHGYTRAGLL